MIEGTDNLAIMENVIEAEASGVLLENAIRISAAYNDGIGSQSLELERDIIDQNTQEVARIMYPTFSTIVGKPTSGDEVDNFF